MKLNSIFWLYITAIGAFFLYSFTQIDLSLTFSRITFLRNLVKSFQYIGYFNRPLSTYIYFAFLILLYGLYFYFINLSLRRKLSRTFVWRLILATTVILVFSYNAFSYDIFNYIFDAKIFTHYHLNPYLHKALDFPGDPMLSFMRWTHRTYPYGPMWLILTIPLSYLGHGLFLPTFFLFKLLMALSFLGSIYFIEKILHILKIENVIQGVVFFALNPLVIIECLMSAHMDIVMIFFALWSTYLLINKKYILSAILLFISIEIKFSTLFLVPVFFLIAYLQTKKKKINWGFVLNIATIFMLFTVVLTSFYSGNFQPWYLILPLSYAVFIVNRRNILVACIILSVSALLVYAPYLYLGNWNAPVPSILQKIYIIGVFLAITAVLFPSFRRRSFAT